MNKKAGIRISLKTIIGLVIAIMLIVILLPIFDKFILFGKGKEDYQKIYFEKLNSEIENLETNQKTSQLFDLQPNYLLISFSEKDVVIEEKDKELYSGYKKDVKTTITKPSQCTNCLCLCITKIKKYLSEDDCLQANDVCTEHKKKIENFYLFGQNNNYNLIIEKTPDKITIKNEQEK